MLPYLQKDRWSAYVVGILLAILSICSFFFFHHMLGSSTVFVRIAAALLYQIIPSYVANNAYYASYLTNNYWINWQMALLIGVFIGAYTASRLHKKIIHTDIPSIWKKRFGNNKIKRFVGAFIGGIFIIFGARLAGGCTSGHAITGGMQLAAAGWVFMISVFAVGIPTAFILYTKKGA